MRSEQFLWENVFADSAKILVTSLFDTHSQILKAATLYEALYATYLQENKAEHLPNQITYLRKLHKKLNVPYEQRIGGGTLYRLIGMYPNASVTALAEYLQKLPSSPKDVPCYLFLTMEKCSHTSSENPEMLSDLCLQLRHKLPEEYQVLSWEDDTIVMICPNPNARKAVRKFLLVLQGGLVYTQHTTIR